MTGREVIELIGLDRAKSVNSKGENLLESESIIMTQLKEQNFEVDSVYFNTDENRICSSVIIPVVIRHSNCKSIEKSFTKVSSVQFVAKFIQVKL